ncbi:hypothetical protein ACFVXQ_07795 [Kitasatospora sp. NPDC058263]
MAMEIERLRRLFASDPASTVGGRYFATSSAEKAIFHGTAVEVLGQRFARRASGLIVPEASAAAPAPIDLVATYITHQELTGERSDIPAIFEILKAANLGQVLRFASQWLARCNMPVDDRDEIDRSYVEEFFGGDRKAVANSLLQSGRVIVAPQLLHVLCKLAILLSPADGAEVPRDILGLLPLGIGDHMGGGREEAERIAVHENGVPGHLTRELISNQHFNYPQDIASAMGRFTRRWRELSSANPHPILGSMEDLFRSATGVTFDELEVVIIALYATLQNSCEPFFAESFFDGLGIRRERALAALDLVSCSLPEMKLEIANDHQSLGGGFEWSISTFERYPVIWASDAIVVIDPKLLINRIFGWMPFFDVYSGLSRKAQGQFREYAGRISEMYALEVISSIAPARLARRFYGEDDLRAAYGKDVKVVDAVIDYGDSWVVLDVSTRQLMRGSVAGTSATDVKKDIDALAVAKAHQIQSTINCLRADEGRLTGHPAPSGRRYYPVVVASEGFPVGPVTGVMIEDAVRREGVLQELDVAPLQIVDTVDLELIESIEERGLSTFTQILRDKPAAGLARMSIRDYVLIELGMPAERSERMEGLWAKPFSRVINASFPAAGSSIDD